MLRHSLPSLLERAKKVLLIGLLKPITDTNPQTKQRNDLRYWVWVVIWGVTVAVLIVGGRFLFFEVEGDPFRLPMKARDWTGFGESYDTNVSEVAEKGTETVGETTKRIDKVTTTQKKLQPAKTLWDWMGLLLAPATLAVLGFIFQSSQEQAKRDKEEADKKRDADQQREEALQAYFDQLSALLVDKRLLRKVLDKEEESTNVETQLSSDNLASKSVSKIDVKDSEIDAEAALDVVKAKTLALFRLFDNADPTDMPRKASVLAFLGDTGLLKALALDLSQSHWREANLRRANFRSADLIEADFSSANLSNADLSSANLFIANLSNAILSSANLSNANLSSANLMNAILFRAILSSANLMNANLMNANLSNANLSRANLSRANLSRANLSRANLMNVNLIGANLIDANLYGADLRCANLRYANLIKANFSNAILLEADLTQIENLAQSQLEGENPPLLCKVTLPAGINVNPNRDCERLPEVLQRRYPNHFKTLKEAQDYVSTYSKP